MDVDTNSSGNQYRYNSHGELWHEFLLNIVQQLEVVESSYRFDRWTYMLQVANVVLAYNLLHSVLEGFIAPLSNYASAAYGLLFSITFICPVLLQPLTDNSLLKWQTAFKLNRKMTRDYLFILIALNITAAFFVQQRHQLISQSQLNINDEVTGSYK